MSLMARVKKLFDSFRVGSLFDGITMEDIARHGIISEKKHIRGPVPYGVRRAAVCIGAKAVVHALRQPVELRGELSQTRKTDIFRKERGWQLSLRDGREEKALADIAKAEAEAVATVESLGLPADAQPKEVAETLRQAARDIGCTEPEMEFLERILRPLVRWEPEGTGKWTEKGMERLLRNQAGQVSG